MPYIDFILNTRDIQIAKKVNRFVTLNSFGVECAECFAKPIYGGFATKKHP